LLFAHRHGCLADSNCHSVTRVSSARADVVGAA
jgi:hypothetical protein